MTPSFLINRLSKKCRMLLIKSTSSPRVLATSRPGPLQTAETLSTNGVFSQEKQCSVCLQAMLGIIPTPGLQLHWDKQVIAFCMQTKEPMVPFHPIKIISNLHIVQDQPIKVKGSYYCSFTDYCNNCSKMGWYCFPGTPRGFSFWLV